MKSTTPEELVQLARELGRPERKLVIIGEGNVSLRVDDETFWVKASGHQMPNITVAGFAQIRFEPILALFEHPPQTNIRAGAALQEARVDRSSSDPLGGDIVSCHAAAGLQCELYCPHPSGYG